MLKLQHAYHFGCQRCQNPNGNNNTFVVQDSEMTNGAQNNDNIVQDIRVCSCVERESVETGPFKIQKTVMSAAERGTLVFDFDTGR